MSPSCPSLPTLLSLSLSLVLVEQITVLKMWPIGYYRSWEIVLSLKSLCLSLSLSSLASLPTVDVSSGSPEVSYQQRHPLSLPHLPLAISYSLFERYTINLQLNLQKQTFQVKDS